MVSFWSEREVEKNNNKIMTNIINGPQGKNKMMILYDPLRGSGRHITVQV